MSESVDGTPYGLFDQQVVDVLRTTFNPHASDPDGVESGYDAPGLETQVLAEPFPVTLHDEEHGDGQRRHQKSHRPLGEKGKEDP